MRYEAIPTNSLYSRRVIRIYDSDKRTNLAQKELTYTTTQTEIIFFPTYKETNKYSDTIFIGFYYTGIGTLLYDANCIVRIYYVQVTFLDGSSLYFTGSDGNTARIAMTDDNAVYTPIGFISSRYQQQGIALVPPNSALATKMCVCLKPYKSERQRVFCEEYMGVSDGVLAFAKYDT